MRHDRVAGCPLGDRRADLDHRARRLDPQRHRRPASHIPAAGTDELVPVARAGGPHLDEHLVVGEGPWVRHLDHLDRGAHLADPGYLHLALLVRGSITLTGSGPATAGATARYRPGAAPHKRLRPRTWSSPPPAVEDGEPGRGCSLGMRPKHIHPSYLGRQERHPQVMARITLGGRAPIPLSEAQRQRDVNRPRAEIRSGTRWQCHLPRSAGFPHSGSSASGPVRMRLARPNRLRRAASSSSSSAGGRTCHSQSKANLGADSSSCVQ